MTTPSRPTRLLRVGIIRHGKIVQERLIRPGDPVTVGTAETCTFVLPPTPLASVAHPLFEPSERGYVLHLTDGMTGTLRTGRATVSLARDPSAVPANGAVAIPLTQQDRGKIVLGDTIVLFQFVAPPPVTMQRMDFRPRLFEEDDPVFMGFLGVWSALASILVIWVWSAEPPAYEMTDLPDRIAKLTLPPRVVVPDMAPESDAAREGTPVHKAAAPTPTERVAETPADPVDSPQDDAELRAKVLEQSTLLAALVGTTGASPTQADTIWSPEDKGLADIDRALTEAGGITTDASHAGPRTGGGGTDRAADIEDLLGVGGGKARSIEGPAVALSAVRSVPGEIDVDNGDRGVVLKTIEAYARHLSYCYERRLKVHPDLAGRVEVSWVVEDGAVVGTPLILLNTTGDDALATCVQQRIRRWHFEGFSGEASNPFLFQHK